MQYDHRFCYLTAALKAIRYQDPCSIITYMVYAHCTTFYEMSQKGCIKTRGLEQILKGVPLRARKNAHLTYFLFHFDFRLNFAAKSDASFFVPTCF